MFESIYPLACSLEMAMNYYVSETNIFYIIDLSQVIGYIINLSEKNRLANLKNVKR